jgi:hypothetical protein
MEAYNGCARDNLPLLCKVSIGMSGTKAQDSRLSKPQAHIV